MNDKERQALLRHHRQRRFPHEGGCPRCREVRICNVCGRDLDAHRCTNGRCPDCHRAVCGPGGSTDAGHGFGSREAAELAARLNEEVE